MMTLKDIALKDLTLDGLGHIKRLRDGMFQAPSEICIERAVWITEYMKKHTDAEMIRAPLLHRAGALANYLGHKKAILPDDNLLAGTTGGKLKSAPVYPEFIGQTIWAELDTVSKRPKNPLLLSKEDAAVLNLEIYPYWMDRDVLAASKKKYGDIVPIQLLEKLIFYIAAKAGCISHTVPFFERVLAQGLDSIMEEARAKAAKGGEEAEFYQSVVIVMEAFLGYVARLQAAAKKRAEDTKDPKEQEIFEKMAATCANIPAKPCTNFREAVNCVWLCMIAIHAENTNMAMSPGRLDQVLYPYYQKDIESGAMTMEEAAALVSCLWIKLSDNVNLVPQVSEELFGGAGTAPAVTVGGITPEGKDAVNDLTYVMLRVTELLNLREPNMNARYHYEVNTKEYRDRVAGVIASTKAVPAFHNDVANQRTLENQGVQTAHARDYSIIGCVELAASGRSYDASSAVILNLSAPMEMALYNGKRYLTGEEQFGPKTGDPADFTSYRQFEEAFDKQLKWLIAQGIEANEKMAVIHRRMLPTPVLSTFFDGPLEKGKDLIFGGARYNSSGVTHVGFADTVDSLNAVKAVFEDGLFSMQELIAGIRADFQGEAYRPLQAYLQNKTLKYGTAAETKEGASVQLIQKLYDIYQSYTNYRGGKYRPAYWSMTNHAGQGKITYALPNGRNAHRPFASGITPVSTSVKSLTEGLNSVAALNALNIPGGEALNIKFTAIENEADVSRLGDFVEGYFRNGGQQVQFNIMSRQMLKDAKAHPEKYPELLVRVSGYSAYFKDLNETMKDELITRAEYGIHDGRIAQ